MMLSKEEKELVSYYQDIFLKTYLTLPPTELLEVIVIYHRIAKQFEKLVQNITIQLQNPNSDINVQRQIQANMVNRNMMR